ncbi:hypothetical protein LZC95_38480 [Pendulispora brunnea]|uniref:Dickkopf N-terminal cysteine-rich domain-containing protein n=1 Tax=Pendulispora brunnea TaxID=2905690 RepID=A0ABZ2K7J3_9BACT
MKWLRCGVPLLVVAIVLGACGGDDEETVPDGTIAEKDFVSAYAHAFCDNVGECCMRSGGPYEASACLSARRREFANVAALSGTYKGDKAYSCVQAAEAAARACAGTNEMERVCGSVYEGKKDAGADCSGTVECFGARGGEAVCMDSKCRRRVQPAEGVDCAAGPGGAFPNIFADCSSTAGFSCPARTGKCHRLGATFETCETSDDCMRGTYCAPDGSGTVRRCRTGAPVGGSCRDAGCDANAYCNTTSYTCGPKSSEGASCVNALSCQDDCIDGVCVDVKARRTCRY